MVPPLLLLAVRDGEAPVVEGVGALGVAVRAANPALDGSTLQEGGGGGGTCFLWCVRRYYAVSPNFFFGGGWT